MQAARWWTRCAAVGDAWAAGVTGALEGSALWPSSQWQDVRAKQ
jgi:hypothetical protein